MPYCTSCGYAVASGAQFCRGCGKANAGEPARGPAPPRPRPAPAPFPSWVLVVLLALFASHPGAIETGVRGLVVSAETILETLGRTALSAFDVQHLCDAYQAVVSLLASLTGLM